MVDASAFKSGSPPNYQTPYPKELMEVTFISHSHILGYYPGVIYKTNLTPILSKLLEEGRLLTLIDPLTLEEPEHGSPSTADSEKHPEASGTNRSDGANSKSRKRASGSEATSSSSGRIEEPPRQPSWTVSEGLTHEDHPQDDEGRSSDSNLLERPDKGRDTSS
jgi:hypothetical protein